MLINEVFGWGWILLGLFVGAVIGVLFQEENWLGGYGSHPRRLIRLGHISFIGLGILNIMFAYSLVRINLSTGLIILSSSSFVLGAITMPICCGLTAWQRRFQCFFAIPVISLHIGAILTFIGLMKAL